MLHSWDIFQGSWPLGLPVDECPSGQHPWIEVMAKNHVTISSNISRFCSQPISQNFYQATTVKLHVSIWSLVVIYPAANPTHLRTHMNDPFLPECIGKRNLNDTPEVVILHEQQGLCIIIHEWISLSYSGSLLFRTFNHPSLARTIYPPAKRVRSFSCGWHQSRVGVDRTRKSAIQLHNCVLR